MVTDIKYHPFYERNQTLSDVSWDRLPLVGIYNWQEKLKCCFWFFRSNTHIINISRNVFVMIPINHVSGSMQGGVEATLINACDTCTCQHMSKKFEPWSACTRINKCPSKDPNLGPATMQTFSSVYNIRYALGMSDANNSKPFSSTQKQPIQWIAMILNQSN